MRVNTISFNYDSKNVYNVAVNLRYNYSREIDTPEYDSKIKRNCPICYSSDNVNDELIIKISFQDEENTFNREYLNIRGLAYDEKENILGTTKTHSVGFINGCSQGGSINFNLNSNKINSISAGKFNCCYKWQYRKNETDEWTDFDVTEHTVYIIPHKPLSKAWVTDSFSSNYVPWADALEFICTELKDTSKKYSDDDISKHVAKWINEGNFVYDDLGECNYSAISVGIGSTLYPIFNPKKFLDDFSKAHINNKLSVNCNDCACINTFFLSLLGIDNDVGYISSDINFSVGFKCNEIVVIGDTKWHVPFYNSGISTGMFSYHAVCSYNFGVSVTDSCLKIDFGTNPWSLGDPTGATKDGKIACKTLFADPATTPGNPPKVPYVSEFYRERLCDLTSLTAGSCRVVSTSDKFEFTTALYNFHMKEKSLANKYLTEYSENLLNENKLDTCEKFYLFDNIKLNGKLNLLVTYLNDEKTFCSMYSENEKYKNISVYFYLCENRKKALSCADNLIFENAGHFETISEYNGIFEIVLKSLSGKIAVAVKENMVVKIINKNDSVNLMEFANSLFID